jgi:hypothetical protein
MRFYEGYRTNEGRDYICQLQDLAFSAGFYTTFLTMRFKWPNHLIEANLNLDAKANIQYGTLFNQFIASMITNRPIHCYYLQPNLPRAQRQTRLFSGNSNLKTGLLLILHLLMGIIMCITS